MARRGGTRKRGGGRRGGGQRGGAFALVGGKGQRGGMGLNGTILSTALVPISLVLANQYWPGTIASTRKHKTGKGTKRRRKRRSTA